MKEKKTHAKNWNQSVVNQCCPCQCYDILFGRFLKFCWVITFMLSAFINKWKKNVDKIFFFSFFLNSCTLILFGISSKKIVIKFFFFSLLFYINFPRLIFFLNNFEWGKKNIYPSRRILYLINKITGTI